MLDYEELNAQLRAFIENDLKTVSNLKIIFRKMLTSEVYKLKAYSEDLHDIIKTKRELWTGDVEHALAAEYLASNLADYIVDSVRKEFADIPVETRDLYRDIVLAYVHTSCK